MGNEFRRRDGSRVRAIRWTGTESAADIEKAPGWLRDWWRREDSELEAASCGNKGFSFPPHTQPTGPVGHRWASVQDEVLVELTDVAEEIASSIQGPSDRVVAAAYQDLADAATRLLLIRHGNERLRELQPAAERPAKRHAL